ncbi:MAG: hypothetical protein ING52_08160 [Burkholderiales bacterium]|jgi:hypothetical protein|nr:hypothetical protein [Burkholderiales bacterium]MCE2909612.1 hypothetical protein [Burkholderiaceae bacterium]
MSTDPSAARLLVAVLGMHRSGTSAVARALNVFGVALGEQLHAAAQDNEKGFWEDIDVVRLSDLALAHLGKSWTSLAPLTDEDFAALQAAGFVDEAAGLLAARLQAHPRYGFKDPRVARLGLLWRVAMARCGVRAAAVVVLRHPLSVARSLARRDGLSEERSLLLWLEYTLASLRHSAGLPRLVLDYDLLMVRPAAELARMGAALGLPLQGEEAARFAGEFLDEGLRHSRFEANELARHPAALPLTADVYRALLACAEDRDTLDSAALQDGLRGWCEELARLRPVLLAADQGDAVQARRLPALEDELARVYEALREAQELAGQRQVTVDQLQAALEQAQALAVERAAEVEHRQLAVDALQSMALERAAAIDRLQAALDTSQGQQVAAESERARWQAAYASVVAARTWRMTEPLRRLGAALTRKPLPGALPD